MSTIEVLPKNRQALSIPKMLDLHQPPPMGSVGILPAETATGIEMLSIPPGTSDASLTVMQSIPLPYD